MIDYGEMAKVQTNVMRRARKNHICTECRRTIAPGEVYEVVTGLWGDYWDTYKTCEHCLAVREWLSEVCSGWVYTQVYEDLHEHQMEGYNPRWLAIACNGIERKWIGKDGQLWKPMKLPKNLPM